MGPFIDPSINVMVCRYIRRTENNKVLVITWYLQALVAEMIGRSFVMVVLCCGFFFYIQTSIPKATASKRTSGVKEYMNREHRRRRQNYMEPMVLETELFDNADEVGPPYELKSTDADENNKEELPGLIVDYANMIRNNIILLDNSVETRTRKRGNVKVEKHSQAIPDVPCSCEYSKEIIDMGVNCYPRYIENRNCSKAMCSPPYKCQPNIYELTILKRRSPAMEESTIEIPSELKHRWIANKKAVTIGCLCTRDYMIDNGL